VIDGIYDEKAVVNRFANAFESVAVPNSSPESHMVSEAVASLLLAAESVGQ